MEEAPEQYQLKENCLLVDAKDEDGTRYPLELPFAHVLDTSAEAYTYLGLSDSAAFIAGFIVLGVDVALIPEILRSEYRLTLGDEVNEINFEAEVRTVVEMLNAFIEKRTFKMPYEPPNEVEPISEMTARGVVSGYSLDFGVHSVGIACIKIPPPPPPLRVPN